MEILIKIGGRANLQSKSVNKLMLFPQNAIFTYTEFNSPEPREVTTETSISCRR